MAIPLEREFEAWIVHQLEEALQGLGLRTHIAAVSPQTEFAWPADEELNFSGKVLGLQFKRPHRRHIGGQSVAAWNLRSRNDQLKKIKRISEIYYALPTLTERRHKSIALHGCLFWRPSKRHSRMEIDEGYIRPRSYVSSQVLSGIADCSFGKRPQGDLPVGWYVRLLAAAYSGRVALPDAEGVWSRRDVYAELLQDYDEVSASAAPGLTSDDEQDDAPLYIVSIEINGGNPISIQ